LLRRAQEKQISHEEKILTGLNICLAHQNKSIIKIVNLFWRFFENLFKKGEKIDFPLSEYF